MFESSITVKGQTKLPKAVRDSLAVKAGDKVRYVILEEGVLIMPVRSIFTRPRIAEVLLNLTASDSLVVENSEGIQR